MSDTTLSTGLQRRTMLKGTAGILASGIAPFVHAQEPITLRYLGTAVNQDKAIAEKFKADTGITIQYVAVTTDDVTKRAVDRARRGEGVTLVELMTYRRKGHAEHDNQSYVPEGEIERWAAENDPLDRYARVLTTELGVAPADLTAIDERVRTEVDEATQVA